MDIVNGFPGHELKYNGRKLVGTYLRIGLDDDDGAGAWRTYKVRQDFAAATKIQTEDDITASTVVPAGQLSGLNPAYAAGGDVPRGSLKFAVNCEYRLFQRPDDAVHRGLDRQTEADMSRPDNFISNFEPLTAADAAAMVERVTEFDQFSPPMRHLIESAADTGGGGTSSARPCRGWWTASRRRTRGTCRSGPTCSTRWRGTWPSRACGCCGRCRPWPRSTGRWTRC